MKLLVGTDDGSSVALGTAGGSVFVSDDGGAACHEVASGLPPIRALAAGPS